MAGNWTSTESAPRDGTRIIGWFCDRAIVVFWRSGPEYVNRRATGKLTHYWSDGYSRFREPDCWQPEPQGPDAAEFPVKEPPKPRGPTMVVAAPAARRRIVEQKPKRETLREKSPVPFEFPREWCGQCERNVTAAEAKFCQSIFCKAKERA